MSSRSDKPHHNSLPKITLIVAAAENDVIGRDGQLPWKIRSDLRLFRRLTMGKPVVMGRKTYESIGKPLDGRDNIIVTRNADFAADGIVVTTSVSEAIDEARRLAIENGADEIMIIGGAEVFRQTLPVADRIYLTRVHGKPDGDTFLPAIETGTWQEIGREPVPKGDADEFSCTLITLERARGSNHAAPAGA
jgi:dihydrofolate reductase